MNKSEVRKLAINLRNNLSPEQKLKASGLIVESLKKLPIIKGSRTVLSYMPYGNEVDVLSFNQWVLNEGKNLCIPRVTDSINMDAVKVNTIDKGLVSGHFGIPEPVISLPSVNTDEIDVVLVPGLAFDRHGNRLGHGKGYYDRFLGKCGDKVFTIAIAYSFQVFDSIPYAPHDIKIKAIITEEGYYTF